jgi:integration host factor subunit alpha
MTTRTITKADLVEAVHEKVGFSKKESSEVVEKVFETMKQTLEGGDGLKISGFGKFDVRRKNARRGRNPKTEDALIIPERTVVTFKASQVLKAAVAGDPLAESTDDDDGTDDEDEDDEDHDG